MKHHAEYLGIKGNMYIALACIITGRPWSVILKGIDKIKPNEQEVISNIIKQHLWHEKIDQISKEFFFSQILLLNFYKSV